MLASFSLFSSLLLLSLPVNTAVIRRDSPVNFPLKKRLDLHLGSLKNIVVRDVTRAKSLRSRAQSLSGGMINGISSKLIRGEVYNEEITNRLSGYTTFIGVGTPPTPCRLSCSHVDEQLITNST